MYMNLGVGEFVVLAFILIQLECTLGVPVMYFASFWVTDCRIQPHYDAVRFGAVSNTHAMLNIMVQRLACLLFIPEVRKLIFGLESSYCDYGYCVAFLSLSKILA